MEIPTRSINKESDVHNSDKFYYDANILNGAIIDANVLMEFLLKNISTITYLEAIAIRNLTKNIRKNLNFLKANLSETSLNGIILKVFALWNLTLSLPATYTNATVKAISKDFVAIFQQIGPNPASKIEELSKTFIFDLPFYAKYKYVFLPYIFEALKYDGKFDGDFDILTNCFCQLEWCLNNQNLASVTADSFSSLAEVFIKCTKLDQLVGLMKQAILSETGIIRQNFCRLWLPKLGSIPMLKDALLQLNFDLLTQCHSESVLGGVTNDPNNLLKTNYDVEDDSPKSSSPLNREKIVKLAFLSSYFYVLRLKKPKVAPSSSEWTILKCTFRSREVRIIQSASECLDELLRKHVDLSQMEDDHTLTFVNFIRDALSVVNDDSSRKSLFSLIDSCPSAVKDCLIGYLESWIRNSLSDGHIIHTHIELVNHLELISILLPVLLPSRHGLNSMSEFLVKCLLWRVDSRARQLASKIIYSLINKGDLMSIAQLKELFNERVTISKFEAIQLFELLLKLGHAEIPTDVLEEGVSLSFEILRVKYGKAEKSPADLIRTCLETNERLLKLGGSEEIARCLAVSELNSWLNDPDDDDESSGLFWPEKQRIQISKYADGLIQSCSLLETLLSFSPSKCSNAAEVISSIWNVLLRSHHKGVIEHCSRSFQKSAKYYLLDTEGPTHLLVELLTKTLDLLADEDTQSRDIAFSKILTAICSVDRLLIDQTFERLLLTLDEAEMRWKVQMRVLQTFRAFFISSEFDLSPFFDRICTLLIRRMGYLTSPDVLASERNSGAWKCFSLSCSTFVAFIDLLFIGQPEMVPLAAFMTQSERVCEVLLNQLVDVRKEMFDRRSCCKFLPLLLAPFQQLVRTTFPFSVNSKEELRFSTKLFSELTQLLRLEPSLLIRKQIVDVLVNMVTYDKHQKLLFQVGKLLSGCLNNGRDMSVSTRELLSYAKESIRRHHILKRKEI